MKNLILLCGTMGVGKSATAAALNRGLPQSVMLDGDWCWMADPFVVTEETKAMVLSNIGHVLRSFLGCSAYENVIFCWVMDEQTIVDAVLREVQGCRCRVQVFALTADAQALTQRIEGDIARGLRKASDVARSLARVPKYATLAAQRIDTTTLSPAETARQICESLLHAT